MIDVKQELIKTLSAYGVPVRAEETRQNFKVPCFFVQLINIRQIDKIQDRYTRIYSFDVQYYAPIPQGQGIDKTNAELEAMGAQLAETLILLPQAKLRGNHISYRVVDNVLHFLVDYAVSLVQPREYPKMKQLTEEVKPYERNTINENRN